MSWPCTKRGAVEPRSRDSVICGVADATVLYCSAKQEKGEGHKETQLSMHLLILIDNSSLFLFLGMGIIGLWSALSTERKISQQHLTISSSSNRATISLPCSTEPHGLRI